MCIFSVAWADVYDPHHKAVFMRMQCLTNHALLYVSRLHIFFFVRIRLTVSSVMRDYLRWLWVVQDIQNCWHTQADHCWWRAGHFFGFCQLKWSVTHLAISLDRFKFRGERGGGGMQSGGLALRGKKKKIDSFFFFVWQTFYNYYCYAIRLC